MSKLSDSKLGRFFKGVKVEFKKILWPDQETLIKQTLVVLVVAILMGALISVIDLGAQYLIDFLINL